MTTKSLEELFYEVTPKGLGKYAKIIEKYGTSLEETRALVGELGAALRAREYKFLLAPVFMTQEEAAQYGIELAEPLPEDWLLKLTPIEGEAPTISFITPEKWEIMGEDLYISPEGERYTREELDILMAEPPIEPAIPPAQQFRMAIEQGLIPEGSRFLGIEDGQIQYIPPGKAEAETLSTEDLARIYGEQELYRWTIATQYEAHEALRAIFPEETIEGILSYADTDPESFVGELLEVGRTEETETILKFFGANEAQIGEIFGEAPTIPEIPVEGLIIELTPPVYAEEAPQPPVITTIKPDYSVWVEGKKEGTLDPETGQFIPEASLWRSIWERIKLFGLGLLQPFKYVGQFNALPFLIKPEEYGETAEKIESYWEELRKEPSIIERAKRAWPDTFKVILGSGISFALSGLPEGELRKRYDELPWYVQLIAESPAWAALAAPGVSATAARTGLLAKAAVGGRMALPARIGAAALRPVAGFEAFTGKTLAYIFGKPYGAVMKRWTSYKLTRAWHATPAYKLMKPEYRGTRIEKDFYAAFIAWHEGTPQSKILAENLINRIFESYQRGQYTEVVGLLPAGVRPPTTIVPVKPPIIPPKAPPIKPFIPTSVVPEKTISVIEQLKTMGYSPKVIEAMTAEQAWRALFKAIPEAIPPTVKPPAEVLIDAERWAGMTIPEKVELVKAVGLSGKVGSKAWFDLTEAEKLALVKVPEVVKPPVILVDIAKIKVDLIAELKIRPIEQLPAEIKTGIQTPEIYIGAMTESALRTEYGTIFAKPTMPKAIPTELRNIPISQMGKGAIEEAGVREIIGKFSKLRIERMPLEYKEQIQDILKAHDLAFRTDKTLDRRLSLMGHIDRLKAEGLPVEIPEQYVEMAGRVPLRDLTPAQLETIYNEVVSLLKLGALKNRLLKILGKRKVADAVNELVEHIGRPPKVPRVITKEALAESETHRIMEKAKGFVNRTYRIERVLLRMDKYLEGGLFQRTFWQPIEQATNEKIGGVYRTLDDFRALIKKERIDLGRVLGAKVEIEAGIRLSPSEKIGVYLSSLNEDNLLHLKYGNGFSDELIAKVVKSLSPAQKAIAKWLHTYFQREGPAISAIRTRVEGKPLGIVENYFPIRLNWKAQPELNLQQQLAIEDTYRFTAKWASSRIAKSWLRERTHKAIQPVDLDALPIWLTHLQQVEHYKAFAEVIRDLQMIFKNTEFRRAFIAKEGTSLYKILDRWLKQVAETSPLRVASQGEGMLRALRVNAVTAVLGFNITTALKQFPSFFAGASEIGSLPAIRGLFTYLAHPKETGQLVKEFAPQIWQRAFEREIAEARMMKSVGKRVMGKLSPREVFMFLTIKMDRLAVNSLWRGGFDDYLKKHPYQLKEAAEYATKAIRRTQPFFSIKDLPEYWRSNEFLKALTMFTNQLNQYWNYFRFDILGKTMAGRIPPWETLRRIFLMFIVPAVLIGWFTRSRPFKNRKELTEDLTSMGLATIPIMGNWLVSGFRGFVSNRGLITTELLELFQQFTYRINKQDWDKILEMMPAMAGFMIGFPVSQPRRSFEGILALLSGETDDWLRLIWGEWVRERALKPPEHPEVLRIKEEYRELFELYDAYGDKDSPSYIKDDKERREARERLLEDEPEFRDDRRRMVMYNLGMSEDEIDAGYEALPFWKKLLVNMMSTGTFWEAPKVPGMDDRLVELFVDYGRELDAHGANSAEALLFRLDHPELEEFGERKDTFDWAPLELTDTDIKRLRLIAENRELIDLREAWGDRHSDLYIEDDDARQAAYDKQLADNPEFRDDLRRMEAYSRNVPSDKVAEDFVDYGKVVDEFGGSSAEAKLFKAEHPEMFEWGQAAFEWTALWEEGDLVEQTEKHAVWSIARQWRELEDTYEGYSEEERDAFWEKVEKQYVHYKEEGTEYLKTHDALHYALDRRARDAVEAGLLRYYAEHHPEVSIRLWNPLTTVYVDWYMIPRTGWEDDWFLMENPEFYKAMFDLGIWKEERDFSKIPTRDVAELYDKYQSLSVGSARLRFRCKNKALDDWLVLAFGYKPCYGTERCIP